MPDASPVPAARWARRDLLRLGLALPLLAGCSDSPTVQPRVAGSTPAGARVSPPAATVAPGPASPAPAPSVPAAANAEQALSAYAAAVLSGPHRDDLSGGSRRLLTFLRDAHADHALALAGDDPTARPTTAAPSPVAVLPDVTRLGLTDALRRLARQESSRAAAHRREAAAATGLGALLAGSLAVAADSYAAALTASHPPGTSAPRERRTVPLLSDVASVQQLISQLDAVVYGYQLAIGKLAYSSAARARAVEELAGTRRVLDTQIAFLLDRKADVPAAAPAYAPSPDPRSPGDAGRLLRGMQTRLEPYVGLALAGAGSPKARAQALTLLGSVARTARSWGAPLEVWPGWPD